MNQELRKDAKQIIDEAIASVQPDAAVRRALSNLVFSEHVYIVAIGKAGWQMFPICRKMEFAMKKVWF